jgi:hypothetical protein
MDNEILIPKASAILPYNIQSILCTTPKFIRKEKKLYKICIQLLKYAYNMCNDKQIASDESIVKEEEMKKMKVPDYHFHSDLSRNPLQSTINLTTSVTFHFIPLDKSLRRRRRRRR